MKSQLVLLDEKARKKHTHPKKNKLSNYRSKQYTYNKFCEIIALTVFEETKIDICPTVTR